MLLVSRDGLATYLTLGTVASIVFVLPLAWAVFRSLLPSTLVTSAPSTADVHHLTFANYSGLIHGGILHPALNSLLVAVMTPRPRRWWPRWPATGSPGCASGVPAWCSRWSWPPSWYRSRPC